MKNKIVALAFLPLTIGSVWSNTSVNQPMYTAESTVTQESVAAEPVRFEHAQTVREGLSKYHTRLSAGTNKVVAHSDQGVTVFDSTDGVLTYLSASNFPTELSNWYSDVRVGANDNHLFYYRDSSYASFAINTDGALTLKTALTNLDNHISFTIDGETAYTESYSYSSGSYSYSFSLYNQNDTTGTLDSVTGYNTTQHITPISYDASNQVFIFSRTDEATNNLVLSTAVLNNGSWTATTDFDLNIPYYYGIHSAAYNSATGHLVVNISNNVHVLQVSDAGQITSIQQAARSTLFDNYYPQLSFAGNTLIGLSGETLIGFDVTGSGLVNKRTLSHISDKTITTDSGHLVALTRESSLSLIALTNDALSVTQTLSFSDYEFTWPNLNSYATQRIELAGGYMIAIDENDALVVYKADEHGEVSFKQRITGNNHYSKHLFKVDDKTILMLVNEDLYLYQLDEDTLMLEEVGATSITTLLPNTQEFYNIDHFAFADGTLYVFYNDRVSAFHVTDTRITFADTAADGVAGFTGVNNTIASTEHKNKLFAVSRSNNSLYSLAMRDGKITQAVIDATFNTDYSVRMFSTAGQLHIWSRNNIAVYAEQNSGSMQLLANNPQPSHSAQYLWDGFMVELAYNQAIISQFDQTTGLSQQVDTISVDTNSWLRPAVSMGGYIYIATQDTPTTVNTYRVNRAPRQTTSIGELTLHEGVETTFDLANHFVDDDNDTISFNKVSGPDTLTVSDAGVITFNGSSTPAGEAVINVIDSRDLVTSLTLNFDVNAAPALKAEWVAPVMNQQQYFVLNLNDYIADPEGSALTFDGEVPATMQLSAGGLLTGTPTESGSETLQITVTDHSGATATMALEMVINAKPVVDGKLTYRFTTGDAFTIDLAQLFADAEGQALTFTVSDLPTGLTLTESQLTGSADAGNYTVSVTATDSYGAATTADLQLTVDSKSSGAFGFSVLLLLMLAMFRQRRFH